VADKPDNGGEDAGSAPTIPTRALGSSEEFERLLAQVVQAPPIQPALPDGAVIAKRYVVVGVLGAGGMGTVYRAHDRTLDRAVAIKLHRAVTTSDRLRREAIAMAKLAHPNVVTVFEVGDHDGRTFVAMEYVPGATLREWLRAAPRSTHEILEALFAAGQGLAAAHDSGLVHRDIKPDNILVGKDGRVRIGDFGLAQIPSSVDGVATIPLGDGTATGTVLGTPAYMAPEQIDGGELDARTDQYAFCVAAWEALCGERPFQGTNTAELRDAIVKAQPQTGTRRVPVRLRRVLVRGLASAPAARWPSIRALLAALRAAERRPRLIAAAAAATVIAAAIVTWRLWPETDPVAACDRMPDELATALPTATTSAVVGAIKMSGAAHADERAAAVGRAIARVRDHHRVVARDACRASVRKQWSPELVVAARECRDAAAQSARELLSALPVTADTVPDVVLIAAQLPAFSECGDARVLAGWRSTAPEVVAGPDVMGARAQLEAAWILLQLGRIQPARVLHDRVAAGPSAREPAVAARLAPIAARIRSGTYGDAERALSDVYFAARSTDDGELVLRAIHELLVVVGTVRRDAEATERWIGNALSDAEREHLRYPLSAAVVVAVAAKAAALNGESKLALERVAKARSYVDQSTAPLLASMLDSAQAVALMDQGDTAEAIAMSDARIAGLARELGEHHPSVADAYSERASLLVEVGNHDAAVEAAQRARAIIDGEVPTTSAILTSAQINISAALLSANIDGAEAYLEAARARVVAELGEDTPDVALIDTNLALVYNDRGDHDRAVVALRHATAIQERQLAPNHPDLGVALFNLAVAERDAGHLPEAIAAIRRSSEIFGGRAEGSMRHLASLCLLAQIQTLGKNPADALATARRAIELATDGSTPEMRGWSRLEAAKAQIALGKTTAATRRWLTEARALYVEAKLPNRVTECDGLLASLR
jgi:tetratricopeptide (TPR) repeat protein/predicted Ser/Thr protein kinase